MRLEGQVCIITGGGSGIGRGAALTMAEEGATVVIIGRTASKLESVEAEIAITEVGGRTVKLHIGMFLIITLLKRWLPMCLRNLGRIDVLVNNAGQQLTQSKAPEYDT